MDRHAESASEVAPPAANEDDLDPATFLKSIRELSEKREREDEERYRKLEEEVEKGRRDRAARRAERARSISPEKVNGEPVSKTLASLPNTTNSITSPPPIIARTTTTTMASAPPKASATDNEDIPEFKGFGSVDGSKSAALADSSPAQASESSQTPPQSTASSLARSGTLSWQQRRPGSKIGGSRPQSVATADDNSDSKSAAWDESGASHEQIAASLGARDPSWFRQTADRGIGNAAFRKSTEEALQGSPVVSGRRGLPGLSRESSVQPAREGSPARSESIRSDTASRTGSIRDSALSSDRFLANRTSVTSSKPDLKSLIAADESQEKASPMSEQASVNGAEPNLTGRPVAMSSSQARLADPSDRPASPTKGMGGFVQSAMMKRSDSVSKRWSAQPGSSLGRQNSVISNRSDSSGLVGSQSAPRLEPRDGSKPEGDDNATKSEAAAKDLGNPTTANAKGDKDVFTKPSRPHHSRSKSVASNYSTTAEEGHTSPPSSPSKRWSPTKSTWLESAISRPESPKPSPSRNSQPKWMADIAKAKAQRTSADVTPKAVEDIARPESPTKATFGQNMLRGSGGKGSPSSRPPSFFNGDTQAKRSISPTRKMGANDLPSKPIASEVIASSTPPTLRPSEDDGVKAVSTTPVSTSVPTSDYSVSDDAAITPERSDVKPAAQSMSEDSAVEPTMSASKSRTTSQKSKPETPPKPPTDFRSNLRTRQTPQTKADEAPEFLSRFGNLRKTTTQNYVAPDVLKDNILRGKSDLTKTGGPVKSEIKEEFRDSLKAKKELWKKEKEEGIVHERKTSAPTAPQKPEALTKRELLGRTESLKQPQITEKPKTATPEALARHKTLKDKPTSTTVAPPVMERHASDTAAVPQAPASGVTGRQSQTSETSKLAARFNPGLASILARGPPAASSGSNAVSQKDSAAFPQPSTSPSSNAPSQPSAPDAPLEDVRKARAKGPKRRKATGGVREVSGNDQGTDESKPKLLEGSVEPGSNQNDETDNASPVQKANPQPPPGSTAAVMMASLKKEATHDNATGLDNRKPATPAKSQTMPLSAPLNNKPSTPAKGLALSNPLSESKDSSRDAALADQDAPVPEFKGFGSARPPSGKAPREDNKENISSGLSSVKTAASTWGRQPASKVSGTPPQQIQLPSRRDEEASMRSAGLLSSAKDETDSPSGLGIALDDGQVTLGASTVSATAPPKPAKSSRIVSGQLQEGPSSNSPSVAAGSLNSVEETELSKIFGVVPISSVPLGIDTQTLLSSTPHQERVFRTVRKTVQLVAADGSLRQLPERQDYTFFDQSVYIVTHAYTVANGPKRTEMFLWAGSSSAENLLELASGLSKKLAKDSGSAYVHTVRQGFEPTGFLQALGGILVTRRGSRDFATKQYMLCGRKHLGQIVFDEVDYDIGSLCHGFVYLISSPVTLQETKLHLWKGSACSAEETGAARLAAMDLSESGDVIEVDGGAEFPSFLKAFGAETTKASVPPSSNIWELKGQAPDRFATRLFRIQPEEVKPGLFSSIFTRRPSWTTVSPSRSMGGSRSAAGESEIRIEAKEISPFSQSDMEADNIYLLDAFGEIHVLVGPVFPSQSPSVRDMLFAQALKCAAEYAVLAASFENRPSLPKTSVLLGGGRVPEHIPLLFRHWDESFGLWGTGGLMAGSQLLTDEQNEMQSLDLEAVARIVCR